MRLAKAPGNGLSQARGSKILSRSWLLAFCNADRLRSQAERDYIDLVRLAQGPEETGTGGLVLVAGSSGGLHFAALQDLMDLNLSHKQWIEYSQKRYLSLQREMKQPDHEMPDLKGPTLGRY